MKPDETHNFERSQRELADGVLNRLRKIYDAFMAQSGHRKPWQRSRTRVLAWVSDMITRRATFAVMFVLQVVLFFVLPRWMAVGKVSGSDPESVFAADR